MASGDWIALAAAIAATIAAYITYQLQKRTQARSDEQQLNDLIEKIQGGLASVNMPASPVTLEAYAANSVALTIVRGQALEARKLTTDARIQPDWFQNMILAYAFSQAWDGKVALTYWNAAVTATSGGGSVQAHVYSLQARAEFYYNRGLNDDWQRARADLKAARDELRADPDGQGPDLAAQQVASISFRQSGFELDAEGEKAAAVFVAEAFRVANGIGARWRRRNVLRDLGSLVLELQQKQGVPTLLAKAAGELSRQGIGLDQFPDETAALLSMPPDGSLRAMPPDGSLRADAEQPAEPPASRQ